MIYTRDELTLRAVQALDDLGATRYLDPILISEREGIEKPAADIFMRACSRVGIEPGETLHVGDELDAQVHPVLLGGQYYIDNICAAIITELPPRG